jgi:hypothetical protein
MLQVMYVCVYMVYMYVCLYVMYVCLGNSMYAYTRTHLHAICAHMFMYIQTREFD